MEKREPRIAGSTVLAVLLCAALGALAFGAGVLQERFLHRVFLCPPMLALLAAMTARNFLPSMDEEGFRRGSGLCARTLLEVALALLGGTLSLAAVPGIGTKALPVILMNIVFVLAVVRVLGKAMGISENPAVLSAGAMVTCGYAGAAGFGRTVKARESELAFVLVAVFALDFLTAEILPFVAGELGLSANQFGFLAGGSIGSMEAVENAQSVYVELTGRTGYQAAAQVKNAASIMLLAAIPGWVVCKNSLLRKKSRRRFKAEKLSLPWFLLPFALLLIVNSLGILGGTFTAVMKTLTELCFCAALAGVGFRVKLHSIYTRGMKPMSLCVLAWVLSLAFFLIFALLFSGYVG